MYSASLPSPTDNEVDEAFAEDSAQIEHVLSRSWTLTQASQLPAVQDTSHQNTFSGTDPSDVDLNELVRMHFKHQTKQAFTGVRTSQHLMALETPVVKQLTECQQLLKEFLQIIHEQGEKGVGTGLARNARWTAWNPAPGGRDGIIEGETAQPISGNAANAAAVADATAKQVCLL
jgi:hypothetical protein